MARYSRRRGPAADFELTAASLLIPGLTVTRNFGRGTLLYMFSGTVFNGTAGTVNFQAQVLVDETGSGVLNFLDGVAAGLFSLFSFSGIMPVDPGLHTVEVRMFGVAGVGDIVVQDRSVLSVIELPEWDRDDDFIDV